MKPTLLLASSDYSVTRTSHNYHSVMTTEFAFCGYPESGKKHAQMNVDASKPLPFKIEIDVREAVQN